jgi:cysteine desulfurase family protein
MIYLDNAATTFPKPPGVFAAMERAFHEGLGNPGRSGHELSRRSEGIVEGCRERLARLIHAEESRRIILTASGTDSLNMAIKGLVGPGDHVVTGDLEHNSVLRPLAGLGAEVTSVPFDEKGYYRVENVAEAIRPGTRLVALTHGSNVLGTIQPIEEIGAVCRARDVMFLVDGAQTVGCVPIDVQRMPIDLLAAPGHKSLFGPMGTGFLYVGPRVTLRAWREGGTGGDSLSRHQPSELPYLLESGTPNVLGMAGLAAGVEYVESLGWEEICRREMAWRTKVVEGMGRMPWIERMNVVDDRPTLPLVAFRVRGYRPEELAAVLESSFGIGVRAGLHCAPRVHERLATAPDGAVRVSGSALSAMDDVDRLLAALKEMA